MLIKKNTNKQGESIMIKVQIKNKQDNVNSKTYYDRMDLCWDLKFILDFPLHKNYREDLSNKICDLNVGQIYQVFGFQFKKERI